jgi:hypothetical protein
MGGGRYHLGYLGGGDAPSVQNNTIIQSSAQRSALKLKCDGYIKHDYTPRTTLSNSRAKYAMLWLFNPAIEIRPFPVK